MSKKKTKPGRTALVVLGMHRSGTSALAGMLNILGCDKPATPMDANGNNEKGYFESKRLYPLHSELLTSAGSRWDDWLPVNPGWFDSARADEFRDRAIETMQDEFGTSRLFVLKDPRICRLVPFWREVLDEMKIAPRFILTLRNPLEVAASLEKRDRIAPELGQLIWLGHMLEAEAQTRGLKRCFTGYNRLMDNWAGVAETIQAKLGVVLPRMSMGTVPEVEAFLTRDLRHHREDPQKLLANPLISAWVRDSYGIFLRWIDTGEDKADHAALDRIRATFTQTAPTFARLVQDGREQAGAVRGARQEIDRLKEQTEALESARETASAAEAAAQDRIEALSADLQEKSTALQALQELEGALRARAAQTETDLIRHTQEAEESRHRLDSLRGELSRTTSELVRRRAEQEQEGDRRAALEEALKAREAELSQIRSALEQRSHEADEMRRERQDAERRLEETERRLEDTEAELRATLKTQGDAARERESLLSSQLSHKTEELGTLETDLQARSRELAEMTQNLARLQQRQTEERAHNTQLLAGRDSRIVELDARLRTNTREVSDMTRMLADTEHALKLEKARLEEARQSVERAEYAVIAIQSSTSWRLMAPLRALSGLLRGKGRADDGSGSANG